MTKQNLICEVDEVINILKSALIQADAFSDVYVSFLSIYEEAHAKLMNDPSYEGLDLAGTTKKYVTQVSEENANKDLVEALWKVESVLKVMNR